MSILLSPDVVQNRDLPREYNMQIVEQDPMNTFVFSEKDLPGYRAYSADRAPPRFKDRRRIEKTRKSEYKFRRAIPSKCIPLWNSTELILFIAEQTTLVGQVRTEINCLPVENKDYIEYMKRRAKEESLSKPKIHVLNASVGGNTLQPGILGATVDTSAFIVRVPSSFTHNEWTDGIIRQKLVRVVGRSRPTKLSGFRRTYSWTKS